jgi:hypothetical protein
MKFPRPLGIFLLGIWLIAYGASILIRLDFVGKDQILAALAIAAGILLLMNR